MSDIPAACKAAISYVAAELSVIPVYDKRPALATWQRWQTNIPDEPTVRAWWNGSGARDLTPDARAWAKDRPLNVAIVTGAVSGVFVLDVDEQDGLEAALELGIPDTLTVHTSIVDGFQKRQLYFAYPDDISVRNDVKGVVPGCDIRGQGGYVVAPPSVHATGPEYAWSGSAEFSRANVAPAPAWLLARLRERSAGRRTAVAQQLSIAEAPDGAARSAAPSDGAHWVDRAVEKALPGSRNETGFWLACQLRDNGVTLDGRGELYARLRKARVLR